MKSLIVGGSFVVFASSCGLAVVLGAQTAAPPSSKASDTYKPEMTRTLTGCLKPAAKDGDFELTGAVDTKSASMSKATYLLTGVVPPGVRLKNHVDHKVEVSGSVGEDTAEKTLNMHTFKMVADKCS